MLCKWFRLGCSYLGTGQTVKTEYKKRKENTVKTAEKLFQLAFAVCSAGVYWLEIQHGKIYTHSVKNTVELMKYHTRHLK